MLDIIIIEIVFISMAKKYKVLVLRGQVRSIESLIGTGELDKRCQIEQESHPAIRGAP